MNHLDFSHWKSVLPEIQPILTHVAEDGAVQGIRQILRYRKRRVGKVSADELAMTRLANPRARDWAAHRAAALISLKHLPDGQLAQDREADANIIETTREKIRALVSRAIDEGLSTDQLVEELEESYAFSPERAALIAQTEVSTADQHGNLMGYVAAGVQTKESLLSDLHGEGDEDECDDNASVGPIPIQDSFPSGQDAPEYHPNCGCQLLPGVEALPGDANNPELSDE